MGHFSTSVDTYIARLYGSGVTERGQAYLVMEYVEGERLDHYCDMHGLDIRESLALFRKVCSAVSYAHQNLVVHRDLKPANIRVTIEGEPKLLDFGIAKLLHPEGTGSQVDLTVTMSGAMTPEYASPEQLKGEAITTASDVYSLGVVLYELLCGQRPYQLKGRRPDELARAICEEEPPRPSTVAGRTAPTARSTTLPAGEATFGREWASRRRRLLEGDLDNIVAKALRKTPSRRYDSVAAFSEDVRRHCEGLPVKARRDTPGYRAGKFIRRNKVGVIAAGLVAMALIAGLIVATWQAKVALRERDRAHLAQRQAERLNGFLETLLGSVDPSRMGKDVKVSQVLDASSQNIDRELADEPEVLAQAHETLRRSYSHLGMFEQAEQHARAAFVLTRRLHGADDPMTAKAEVALGNTLCDRYHFAEAEPLLRHALSVERRQSVPDQAALAETLDSLSYVFSAQGHPAQGDPFVTEALTHAKVAWGEQSSNYANILNELGNVKMGRRDYAAGEAIFRHMIALQDHLAPGGEHSVTPQINLCISLFNQGKLAETKQVVSRLEQNTRRLFGEKSVYYTVAVACDGIADFAGGDYASAIPLFRQTLPSLAEIYPPGQTTVVQIRATLGLCLTRTGHASEGEGLLRTALADGGQVDRVEFAYTFGNLEVALGECLLVQKRYAEAEPLLLSGHDELETRLKEQNPQTIRTAGLLHDLYTAWNKPERAARFAGNESAPPASAP